MVDHFDLGGITPLRHVVSRMVAVRRVGHGYKSKRLPVIRQRFGANPLSRPGHIALQEHGNAPCPAVTMPHHGVGKTLLTGPASLTSHHLTAGLSTASSLPLPAQLGEGLRC